MEFSISKQAPDRIAADCLVVGVYQDDARDLGKMMTPAAVTVDQACAGRLTQLIQLGDLRGKRNQCVLIHRPDGSSLKATRILVVGLGARSGKDALDLKALGAIASHALAALKDLATPTIAWALGELEIANASDSDLLKALALAVRQDAYRFDQFRSKKDDRATPSQHVVLGVAQTKANTLALSQALAIADGIDFAKDLGNTPPNVATPSWLAEQAQAMAQQDGLQCEVLDEAAIKALGMGAFLAVARGSAEPPRLIVARYQGAGADQAPVALVGKGITFDSGGISIKPAADMDEMKFDMCGAAAVLGTIKAAARMKLALNVVAVVPTCENMPSGTATRPGDVVTSMSGQTIEILNTDAEGRLILCDALTYTERFKPAAVIDVATLTGACVIALGAVNTGLFTPDDPLANELIQAGRSSHDRTWRMPLESDYQDGLKSPVADMANVGSRAAGSVTAACFLWRYTQNYPWAHLDIAGTAWKSGKDKGATGRPVGLLTAFLSERAQTTSKSKA